MIYHKDHFHGSDLEQIEKIYSIDRSKIISFSANVNPLGISPLLKEKICENVDVISRYPDRDYTNLKAAICEYANTSAKNIIMGNGTTELISLFIQAISPKKAMILGPTYSEYERSVSLVGGKSIYYPLNEESDFNLDINDFCLKLNQNINLLIICNPNNPTGTCIAREDMRRILDSCKENGIFCMVDETYIEFVDNISDYSSIPLCDYYNNIIILRGISKFFAAPGLRLGYAICSNKDILSAINQNKNPWMINSIADSCAKYMFLDEDYIKNTKEVISTGRKVMFNAFNDSEKYKPFNPTANFMLIKILDNHTSFELFERCIKQNMMIRDCSSFPFLGDKFIRVCFMNKEDNEKLISLLLADSD